MIFITPSDIVEKSVSEERASELVRTDQCVYGLGTVRGEQVPCESQWNDVRYECEQNGAQDLQLGLRGEHT